MVLPIYIHNIRVLRSMGVYTYIVNYSGHGAVGIRDGKRGEREEYNIITKEKINII